MTEQDDFRDWVEARLIPAERALHDGDAGPRFLIWSRHEPLTILGAWKNAIGPEEVERTFHELEDSFSDVVSYELELVAVEVIGDAACTVGFEHVETTVRGEPRRFTLRATQVYRREEGEWKVWHRHADTVEQATG